jgi:gluconolactonase
VLATCSHGVFDGLGVDTAGKAWAAAGDGLHCVDPDGTLIGKLRLLEICSNLVFGGIRRNGLFVTATTSLYAVRVNINGAARAHALEGRDAARRV